MRRQTDTRRGWRAITLGLVGLIVLSTAALTDVYLHRGIETGAEEPYVIQPAGREPATNVDLTMIPVDQLDTVATTLHDAGFRYVRQPLLWSEIEQRRGSYVWDRYDAILRALAEHQIEPVVVLRGSPDWARDEASRDLPDAPPTETASYAQFVRRVVNRYRDRLHYVQIWDAPNRADHWGGTADPASYASLLAEGSNAARKVNPEIKVVLAELVPPDGQRSIASDTAFLRSIYQAGGKPFFDIVTTRLDGGGRSPYDRRVANHRLNLSRAELFRRIMIEEGDRAKPLWATTYGWRAGSGSRGVTTHEQADFTLSGLERARAEWPWMGIMFAWDLLPRSPDSDADYALLNADGTASPLFRALTASATGDESRVATTGYAPVHAPPLSYDGNWSDQHLGGRTYVTTGEIGTKLTVRFRGTGLIAFLRESPDAGKVHATLDGRPLPGWPVANNAAVINLTRFKAKDAPIKLIDGLNDSTHELTLTLATAGQLTLGGLIIVRGIPFMWPVVVLAAIGAALLFFALRELIYLAALRSGHLQRPGVALWPPLPQLPDWQPSRHA